MTEHRHPRTVRVQRHDGAIMRIHHGNLDFARVLVDFFSRWPEQAHAEIIANGCPEGCYCRSHRPIDRLRTWRDNSRWHHRLVANGPLWWFCADCRALRR